MLEENVKYIKPLIGSYVAVGITTYSNKTFFFYGTLLDVHNKKLILHLDNGIKEIELACIKDVHTVPRR